MSKSKKFRTRSKQTFQQGDTAIVDAHVGCDGDHGGSVELKGERVEVVGTNSSYVHPQTGQRMVSARLSNGALVSIPARALRHE